MNTRDRQRLGEWFVRILLGALVIGALLLAQRFEENATRPSRGSDKPTDAGEWLQDGSPSR